MKIKNSNGNALFLILIAVALFAALSYAVTQSGRGGAGINKEQASLVAAQIIQYAGSIEYALQRIRLLNGCTENEISFHYDSDQDGTLEVDGSDDYYNPNSPTDGSCSVFHVNGGNLSYNPPDERWLDNTNTAEFGYNDLFFTGGTCVANIGSASTCDFSTTANKELIYFLPYLSQDICIEIAKQTNGLNGSSPARDASNTWVDIRWAGSFISGPGIEGLGSDAPFTNGNLSGCIEGSANPAIGTFHFFYVLLAR